MKGMALGGAIAATAIGFGAGTAAGFTATRDNPPWIPFWAGGLEVPAGAIVATAPGVVLAGFLLEHAPNPALKGASLLVGAGAAGLGFGAWARGFQHQMQAV